MKETEYSGHDQTPHIQTSKEELDQEFPKNNKELCDAATKIQASFRGHMIRKETTVKTTDQLNMDASVNIENKVIDASNEIEGIDLSDPGLHKAATKIQASFRGHKVRHEATAPNTDEEK